MAERSGLTCHEGMDACQGVPWSPKPAVVSASSSSVCLALHRAVKAESYCCCRTCGMGCQMCRSIASSLNLACTARRFSVNGQCQIECRIKSPRESTDQCLRYNSKWVGEGKVQFLKAAVRIKKSLLRFQAAYDKTTLLGVLAPGQAGIVDPNSMYYQLLLLLLLKVVFMSWTLTQIKSVCI